MTTLKPGIYKATVCGVPDVIVMMGRHGMAHHDAMTDADGVTGTHTSEGRITDARPLIVLDLNDYAGVAAHVRRGAHATCVCNAIAGQIEAQTEPPRIEEPGLWGVVEACRAELSDDTSRQRFIRTGVNVEWPWVAADGGLSNAWKWENLGDPTLIREGVES